MTLAHDGTPTVAHLDAQGRTVRSVAHDVIEGVDTFYETRTVLDVQGRVLQVLDARGNEAEGRVYDLAGGSLRVSSVDAGTVRSVATVVGVPLRSISARGFVGRARYDALWRPTHAFVRPPEDAEILVACTVYGESLADPEAANHRGRVYASYDGAGVVTSLGFDFKGNALGQTRRFALEYRSTLDWSVLVGLEVVPAIEAAADPLLHDEAFPVVTAYDGLSRPTAQTTADGSVTQLAYNDAGMLQRVDVAVRGAAVADAEACVSNIDYDVQGRRSLIVYGNGTQTAYSYDARTFRLSRLRTVRDGDPAALQDLRYSYDPVGNVTQIADGAQPEIFFSNAVVTATQRFVYDAVYRLREASGREHTSQGQPSASELTPGPHPDPSDPSAMRTYVQRYVFDAVGNLERVQHEAAGGSWTREHTYAGGGNRLLSTQAPGELPGVGLSYDVAGNMTSMPHLAAMVWDHAERLREVDLGGGGTAYYVYDGAGQRVRKVVENLARTLARERLYVGTLEVYREHVGETVRLERQTLHVADDSGRVAMVETQTVRDGSAISEPANIWRYQYSNHLGSTSLELDAAAQVISYEEFHPFGTSSYRAVNASIEVSPRRYRYTGKERDEETGLDLMGARYYAAWLGRWTASDPIGLGDGVNRFAYVSGNPVALRDPSGTLAAPGQGGGIRFGTRRKEEGGGIGVEVSPFRTNVPGMDTRGRGRGTRGPVGSIYLAPVADRVPEAVRPEPEGPESALQKELRASVPFQFISGLLTGGLAGAAPGGFVVAPAAEATGLDENYPAAFRAGYGLGEVAWGVAQLIVGSGAAVVGGGATVGSGGTAAVVGVPAVALGSAVAAEGLADIGVGGLTFAKAVWGESKSAPSSAGNAGAPSDPPAAKRGAFSRTTPGHHGATGDEILSIIESGELRPNKAGEVFLGGSAGETFAQGADRARKAAFSIEVEVGTGGATLTRTSTPGVPDTTIVGTGAAVPVRVKRLHVRTPDPDGGFQFQVVEGIENIQAFLRGG